MPRSDTGRHATVLLNVRAPIPVAIPAAIHMGSPVADSAAFRCRGAAAGSLRFYGARAAHRARGPGLDGFWRVPGSRHRGVLVGFDSETDRPRLFARVAPAASVHHGCRGCRDGGLAASPARPDAGIRALRAVDRGRRVRFAHHLRLPAEVGGIMALLSQLLYWITTGLLIPTVSLLIVLVVRALVLAGSTIATALDRRRYGSELDQALSAADVSRRVLTEIRLPKNAPLARTMADLDVLGSDTAQAQRILAALEIAHERRIADTRLLARVGPMLGLMGTLIPLGPALLGLAEGDLNALAENMLVAFATTVVGLMIGGIGFTLQQSRQRWAAEDMARAEFAATLCGRERT